MDTTGEQTVRRKYSDAGLNDADEAKKIFAELINKIDVLDIDDRSKGSTITLLEIACMMVVKQLTTPPIKA